MALVTANGQIAYDFQMRRPRIGNWHADMRVDTPDALTGRVNIVIDDGAQTFVGTAVRSAEFVGTAQVRVVGGTGGLGLSARPRHYNGVNLGIVLRDLLRDAGETLSATADQSVLAISLDAWTTTATPIGALIAALIQTTTPGSAWRMLPDGTFWIGAETWPASTLDPNTYQILDQAAEEASMLVAVDRPAIDPGSVFEGRRVSYVQDDVPHVAGVTTHVWFEDEDKPSDLGRMREAFVALVRATPQKFDYRARYWARVIAQQDRTIDVVLEDYPDLDMGRVQLAMPAGMSADGIIGGRVLVGWAGSPARAYVDAFDGGEHVGERVIDGDQVFVGGKVGAEPALKASTYLGIENPLMTSLGQAMTKLAAFVAADPTAAAACGAAAALCSAFAGLSAGAVAAKARVV